MARQILKNSVELWQLSHTEAFYLDGAPINEKIDKHLLWDYILAEFSFMEIVEQDSITFHYRVLQFFKKYKYNIDKLVESQHFNYDPIDNFRWKQHLVRDVDSETHNDYRDNKNGNSENVHFISAFDDIPSPSNGTFVDTEHSRDTSKYNDDMSGDNNGTGAIDTDEVIERTGHADKSFQELIEEERKLSQFNIYNWIADKFSKELLIGIW